MNWIKDNLDKKSFIIDESRHNLCLLPFPTWIDTTIFKNYFIKRHGENANIILGDTSKPVTANYFVIHDTAGTTSTKAIKRTGVHLWLNIDGAFQTHDWHYRGDAT